MNVGSIVLWRDAKSGQTRAWQVEACLYGAEGQESLIRLRTMFQKPGRDEDGAYHDTVLVPEPLLRGLETFSRVEAPPQ